MSNNLTIFQQPGAISSVFAQAGIQGEDLGAGVQGGFGVVGYRGKVWSIKFGGNEHQLMRDDGDGPRGSIDVVLIKAASVVSKIFYDGGYQEGSNTPPDCWSTNGATPDQGSPKKQSATCVSCPKNAWGSRVTDQGKQGKACADSKRIAVVPIGDMKNESFGGPMLLRVPAASLKDVKAFGDKLQGFGYPYFGVATKIAFDPQDAYPHFVFDAVRALSDEEAQLVVEYRNDPRVTRILSEALENSGLTPAGNDAAGAPPASPFMQQAPVQQPVQQPAPVQQPTFVQPAPQPVQQPVMQQAPVQQAAPSAFSAAPAAPAGMVQAPANAPAARKPRTQKPAATQQAAPSAFSAQAQPVQAQPVQQAPQVMQPGQPVFQQPGQAVQQPVQQAAPAAGAPAEFENMLDGLLDA